MRMQTPNIDRRKYPILLCAPHDTTDMSVCPLFIVIAANEHSSEHCSVHVDVALCP